MPHSGHGSPPINRSARHGPAAPAAPFLRSAYDYFPSMERALRHAPNSAEAWGISCIYYHLAWPITPTAAGYRGKADAPPSRSISCSPWPMRSAQWRRRMARGEMPPYSQHRSAWKWARRGTAFGAHCIPDDDRGEEAHAPLGRNQPAGQAWVGLLLNLPQDRLASGPAGRHGLPESAIRKMHPLPSPHQCRTIAALFR